MLKIVWSVRDFPEPLSRCSKVLKNALNFLQTRNYSKFANALNESQNTLSDTSRSVFKKSRNSKSSRLRCHSRAYSDVSDSSNTSGSNFLSKESADQKILVFSKYSPNSELYKIRLTISKFLEDSIRNARDLNESQQIMESFESIREGHFERTLELKAFDHLTKPFMEICLNQNPSGTYPMSTKGQDSANEKTVLNNLGTSAATMGKSIQLPSEKEFIAVLSIRELAKKYDAKIIDIDMSLLHNMTNLLIESAGNNSIFASYKDDVNRNNDEFLILVEAIMSHIRKEEQYLLSLEDDLRTNENYDSQKDKNSSQHTRDFSDQSTIIPQNEFGNDILKVDSEKGVSEGSNLQKNSSIQKKVPTNIDFTSCGSNKSKSEEISDVEFNELEESLSKSSMDPSSKKRLEEILSKYSKRIRNTLAGSANIKEKEPIADFSDENNNLITPSVPFSSTFNLNESDKLTSKSPSHSLQPYIIVFRKLSKYISVMPSASLINLARLLKTPIFLIDLRIDSDVITNLNNLSPPYLCSDENIIAGGIDDNIIITPYGNVNDSPVNNKLRYKPLCLNRSHIQIFGREPILLLPSPSPCEDKPPTKNAGDDNSALNNSQTPFTLLLGHPIITELQNVFFPLFKNGGKMTPNTKSLSVPMKILQMDMFLEYNIRCLTQVFKAKGIKLLKDVKIISEPHSSSTDLKKLCFNNSILKLGTNQKILFEIENFSGRGEIFITEDGDISFSFDPEASRLDDFYLNDQPTSENIENEKSDFTETNADLGVLDNEKITNSGDNYSHVSPEILRFAPQKFGHKIFLVDHDHNIAFDYISRKFYSIFCDDFTSHINFKKEIYKSTLGKLLYHKGQKMTYDEVSRIIDDAFTFNKIDQHHMKNSEPIVVPPSRFINSNSDSTSDSELSTSSASDASQHFDKLLRFTLPLLPQQYPAFHPLHIKNMYIALEMNISTSCANDLFPNFDIDYFEKMVSQLFENTQKDYEKFFHKLSPANKTQRSTWTDPLDLSPTEKHIYETYVEPSYIDTSFDDIGSLEKAKRELQSLIIPMRYPVFSEKNKLIKSPLGVLLYGPPGTGKTMLARALAKSSNSSFINISSSSIISKWLGESEGNAAGVFSLAKKISPCIIFIDEADGLLSTRDTHEHESTRRVKNEFFLGWDGLLSSHSKKDGANVTVIAATNRPFDLDDAALRRLPHRVIIDLPEKDSRYLILDKILKEVNLQYPRKEDIMKLENLNRIRKENDPESKVDIEPFYRNLCDSSEGDTETKKQIESILSGIVVPQDRANDRIRLIILAHLATLTEGYSGSDLKSICTRAALEIVRDFMQDTKGISDQEALMEMANKYAKNPLTIIEFKRAINEIAKSVDSKSKTMSELKRWHEKYGSKSNSYRLSKSSLGFI